MGLIKEDNSGLVNHFFYVSEMEPIMISAHVVYYSCLTDI